MTSESTCCLQAVIFDYGKVLSLAATPEQWKNLALTAGRPLAEFQHDYFGFRDQYDRAACGAAAYWQCVARRALDRPTIEALIALDNEQWTRANPRMVELSRRLRAAGVKTAVLSNMQFELLAAMRAKFPWLEEFEVQIYSCEAGLIKPETEIYLRAAAKLGVKPAQALFLDDKQPNIDGARRAGMKAVLFESPEAQAELESLLRAEGIALPQADHAEVAIG